MFSYCILKRSKNAIIVEDKMSSGNKSEGNNKGLLARFKEIGGTPYDYPPWRLVYNFEYSFHCNKVDCMQPICKEVRDLVLHRRACVRGRSCTTPNCWMYMPVAMHFSSCQSPTCVDCVEIKMRMAEHKAKLNADKPK